MFRRIRLPLSCSRFSSTLHRPKRKLTLQLRSPGSSIVTVALLASASRALTFRATSLLGAYQDVVNGRASGSALLFDATTGTLLHQLTASDAGTNDRFGWSVAIDGDLAIVGANRNDDRGTDSGSAYIFDATTGTELLKLVPSDGAYQDNFGWSVALSGNLALVGAPYKEEPTFNEGAAYLFDATTGTLLHKLTASDSETDDEFGYSVALSGDLALVGAPRVRDRGLLSGAVYVFDTTTGAQLHKLTPGTSYKRVGSYIALSGDLALLGTLTGGVNNAAYLYDAKTGTQLRTLLSGYSVGPKTSVAISGSLALVGDTSDSDNGPRSGAAHLFEATTGERLVKFSADDTAAGDGFGYSVALSGNLALVGEYNNTSGSSAYVFFLEPANQPPVAQCTDVTLECAAGQTANVTVDDGSYDPDNDQITLTQDPAPSYNLFPPGTLDVELTVSDGSESAMCTGSITIEDSTPPEISLSVSPDTLWPPNHKMVLIAVTVAATDECDPNPGVALKSINMNEGDETNTYDPNYDDTTADGNTTDDIQVDADGNIWLRAERSGTGAGRVYTITYEATDASGNTATAEAIVTVPHNQ